MTAVDIDLTTFALEYELLRTKDAETLVDFLLSDTPLYRQTREWFANMMAIDGNTEFKLVLKRRRRRQPPKLTNLDEMKRIAEAIDFIIDKEGGGYGRMQVVKGKIMTEFKVSERTADTYIRIRDDYRKAYSSDSSGDK